MRPFEDIEKFVKCRKPMLKTGKNIDKQTLNDSYAAMGNTLESSSNGDQCSTFRFAVPKRAIALLAAAAVVLIGISLFLDRSDYPPEIPTPRHREAARSETKLISMMSLRLSYQQGGFDALDEQFRDTLNRLGPPLSNISMRDLLEGGNGS